MAYMKNSTETKESKVEKSFRKQNKAKDEKSRENTQKVIWEVQYQNSGNSRKSKGKKGSDFKSS